MTTHNIAQRLVELCKAGAFDQPYQELYSPNIISVEQQGPHQRCEGMENLMEKGKWWHENFEVHSVEVSEPLIADDWFTLTFTMDTTHKPSGMRSTMTEIAVYKTQDGKIIYEEFFYTPMAE